MNWLRPTVVDVRDSVERDGWVSRRLDAVVGGGRGTHGARSAAGVPDRGESAHGARPSHGRGADGTAGATPLTSAFDPGKPGMKALAAVAGVVVVGAAAFVWLTRPEAEVVAPAPAFSASAPAVADPGSMLVVAVAGRVKYPGLVRLPAGSRVADAITAAGGVLPGTDMTSLNLARKLVDGELVTVGVAAPGGGRGEAAGGKVNLNAATLAQLDGLPGVGPVLAQRIIAWRDKRGGFRSVTDLRQVEGIGDAKFEQLKELVTV